MNDEILSDMHQALDVGDYLNIAILAGGMMLVYILAVGPNRYKSIDEIPKRVLVRIALIGLPLVVVLILIQTNHRSTPWLMYTPVSWLRPV